MKDKVRVFCLSVKSVKSVRSVECSWGVRGEGGEADSEDKHHRQTSVGRIKTEGYTLPLQGRAVGTLRGQITKNSPPTLTCEI